MKFTAITICSNIVLDIDEVRAWCREYIGQQLIDWSVVGHTGLTRATVIHGAFKEEKFAALFALRWS